MFIKSGDTNRWTFWFVTLTCPIKMTCCLATISPGSLPWHHYSFNNMKGILRLIFYFNSKTHEQGQDLGLWLHLSFWNSFCLHFHGHLVLVDHCPLPFPVLPSPRQPPTSPVAPSPWLPCPLNHFAFLAGLWSSFHWYKILVIFPCQRLMNELQDPSSHYAFSNNATL